ncbi:FtsX-like permease family protein [Microbacterium sp. SL62]|uniref:FtsX-like permease family protein n=1 Tax=Microbacterium sp. SL62 TaxID=2995139 RepID=UPI0022749EB7|nr:FtsX-like permease family protein [Microbacterium sp. SL62]MCY1716450.1 FtsX-like permease family protein [Microbacterium sp. SL62]
MSTAFAIGMRQLRVEYRRFVVVGIALTLSTALLGATPLAATSLSAGLHQTVGSLASETEVTVTSDDGSASLTSDERGSVAVLPDVATVQGRLDQPTAARVGDDDVSIILSGREPAALPESAAGALQGMDGDDSTFPVVVPSGFASSNGIVQGDVLTIASPLGSKQGRVTELVDSSTLSASDRSVVVAALADVRKAFGVKDGFSSFVLSLSPGTTADAWQKAHARDLPAGLTVASQTALTSAFANLLVAVTAILGLIALSALVVAVALTAGVFEAGIRQGAVSFGALRSTGASKRWLATMIVTQTIALTTVCTAIGFVLSIGLSTVLVSVLASAGALTGGGVLIEWWHPLALLGVGVVAGLIGGGRAALRVVSRSPVESLHGATPRPPARRMLMTVRVLVALSALVAGAALTVFADGVARAAAAVPLLIAAAMLGPMGLAAAKALQGRLWWPARLAADRVLRGRELRAVTSVMAVVVCLATGLSVGAASLNTATETVIGAQYGADVRVASPVAFTDGSFDERLHGIDGVGTTSGFIGANVELSTQAGDAQSARAMFIDPESYFRTAQFAWTGGTAATPQQVEADGLVLSESYAQQLGVQVGDRLTLSRGSQTVAVTIVGTYTSIQLAGNNVVTSRAVGERLGVEGVAGWTVLAAGGIDPEVLRQRVQGAFADIPGLWVSTSQQVRTEVEGQISPYISTVALMVVLALILGALGVGGAFALSVVMRGTEFGVLRALGAQRGGIRGLVLLDSMLVGVAALVVGIPTGLLMGAAVASSIGTLLRIGLSPAWDPALLGVVAVVCLVALVLAALAPSRRAATTDPIAALRV